MTVVKVERDQIPVETMGGSVYDEKWRFTDAAGHEHRVDLSKGYPSFLTLNLIEDGRYWCQSCGDDHVEDHLECKDCGETIVPGTKYEPPRQLSIAGPTHWYVDDVEVTEQQAKAAMGLA